MNDGRTALRTIGTAAAALWLCLIPLGAQAAGNVKVFAAASLKNALDAVNVAWEKQNGTQATVSYAASSALAKQIEAGAPADVFISADLAWMDYVEEKTLIVEASRSTLLGNRLVLVGPALAAPVDIKAGFDLKGLLAGGKLAMGAVESVPAGKYGKAALESLGVWNAVASDVAGAENVRAALLLVSRGEAPYGIVYATDAKADPSVKVVGIFPEESHPPIVYPAALIASGKNPDAAKYLDFIRSPEAAPLFEAQGFTLIKVGQ